MKDYTKLTGGELDVEMRRLWGKVAVENGGDPADLFVPYNDTTPSAAEYEAACHEYLRRLAETDKHAAAILAGRK